MISSDVIPWRRRRTARWMSLSLAARGAVEGIVAAMDERRELQLPPVGLPALAPVLGRPWEEVEPAVLEALEAGKLAYDAERNVIVDPHADVTRRNTSSPDVASTERLELEIEQLRAELAAMRAAARAAIPEPAAATATKRPPRPLSMTPNAVRKRSARAAKRKVVSVDPRQLELPATGPMARGSQDPDPPNLKLIRKDPRAREAAAAAAVTHDPEQPAPWAFDLAGELRPDLSEYVVREMWRRFGKRAHTSESDAQKHFALWLERQEARPPPSTETSAPTPERAPHAARDVTRPREVTRRHAAPDDVAPGELACLLPLEARREIAKARARELAEIWAREPTGPPAVAS